MPSPHLQMALKQALGVSGLQEGQIQNKKSFEEDKKQQSTGNSNS